MTARDRSKPGERDDAAGDVLFEKLTPLVDELARLRRQAEELGVFTGDRDLLACASCGLMEDVLAGGRLIVVTPSDLAADTGLRFVEMAAGLYRCPGCGAAVSEPENP